VRAIVPMLLVVACIAIGGVALVIPAAIVFPLLALTGASRELGAKLPAPLLDSVAVARTRWLVIAAVAFGAIVVEVAIVAAAHAALIPVLPAQPPVEVLLRFNTFLRVSVAAIIVVAPVPAALLAALYECNRRVA
jgi:hypothetical protein